MVLKVGEYGIITNNKRVSGWRLGDKILRITKKQFNKEGREAGKHSLNWEKGTIYVKHITEYRRGDGDNFVITPENYDIITKIAEDLPEDKIESILLLKEI